MWRSPLAAIARSNTAWRPTWSSMWSRNGMPVPSCVRPLPSIASRTLMSVSAVRRSTSALRTDGCKGAFIGVSSRSVAQPLQHVEERIVFLRRADGDAQALREQRVRAVQVLHQDARVAQRGEPGIGRRYAHEHEIGLRRE